ncbi:MAG: type III-A CRISPR-associated RAMP protein Csm5 [Candidatus Riflebacteria bacterium]|nr:type III-A CRISPR-associated RAMP protein Csm5 [Candidatus Riflebacteria bacterium]
MPENSLQSKIQHLKIRLHVLSPIHIGCDEVYEPTEFVIPDGREGTLISFDSLRFVQSLDTETKKRFEKVCMDGKLIEIYKFIRANSANIKGRAVSISKDLVAHYRKSFAVNGTGGPTDREVMNQFTLSRTAFLRYSDKPFIPGSSLKGSLRTAYLSWLARQNASIKENRSARLEEALLGGGFSADPFSLLKTADLEPETFLTSIGYAMNRKKKMQGAAELRTGNGPYQILETIQPGSVFSGSIDLLTAPYGSPVKQPFTFETILGKSVWKFYRDRFKEESGIIGNLINCPKSLIPKMSDGRAFLIRIGRHSGAESVTIEGYRKIKIMQGPGRSPLFDQDSSTTIWMFADSLKADPAKCRPFGWAMIELADDGVAFPRPPSEERPVSKTTADSVPVSVKGGTVKTVADAGISGSSSAMPSASQSSSAAPGAKPLEAGQTRTGRITQESGKWVASFDGETRSIDICNPQSITRTGSAEFFVQSASKREGAKVKFIRHL